MQVLITASYITTTALFQSLLSVSLVVKEVTTRCEKWQYIGEELGVEQSSLRDVTVQTLHQLLHKIHSSSHTPSTSDSHKLFYFLFFSHAVSIWNSLPYSIVSLPNISVFKKSFVNITYLYNLGTLYY